jgi:DNA-binding PadR family transcriptional regulator
MAKADRKARKMQRLTDKGRTLTAKALDTEESPFSGPSTPKGVRQMERAEKSFHKIDDMMGRPHSPDEKPDVHSIIKSMKDEARKENVQYQSPFWKMYEQTRDEPPKSDPVRDLHNELLAKEDMRRQAMERAQAAERLIRDLSTGTPQPMDAETRARLEQWGRQVPTPKPPETDTE